jgi:hypothetical protein
MAGGDDADVRSYLDPVTNDDEAGVQHSETGSSVSPAYSTEYKSQDIETTYFQFTKQSLPMMMLHP